MLPAKEAKVNIHMNEDDDRKFLIKHSDKHKTIYYNRIPYNQFDMVINADYAEARVQFYYTLKVRYTTSNFEQHQKAKERIKKAEERRKQLEKDQVKTTKKGWFRK